MKAGTTLCRGIPGSGKSTLAKVLVASGYAQLHFEADQFFTDKDGNYNWDGNKQTLLRVAQSLTNIQMSDPETIDFSGELIAISLRGTFEIKSDDKRTIRGEFPNNLLEDIKTLTIGSNYAGKMEKQTIVNMATESEKVYYTLISISHV